MRRLVLPLVALLALALVSSAFAAPLFVVTGRGWGHTVGMSQWGAYGMARQGKTYREILTHYYRGTSVTSRSGRIVGVLLADGRASLAIASSAKLTVDDAERANPVTYEAGSWTVTKTSTGRIKIGDKTFASPATVAPTTAFLALGSTRYRGKLVVSVRNGALRAVNRVGLDGYVKGVVPRESPDYWGSVGAQAALEAQAVAARSYALATGGHCGDGLFCPDTRDQVYGGYEAEAGAPNGTAAVDTTANQVVDYGGSVATTYFHSSSGGRTGDSADVWGGVVPYLKSVPDSDLHADNPHRRWSFTLSASALAARLGTGTPADATLTRDGSGLAQRLTVTRPGWSDYVEGSETLRFRMQTKSARFWIGVLSLQPGRTKVTYGDSVTVRGIARSGGTIGWSSAYVQRNVDGSWSAVGRALPNGTWSRSYTPRRTTDYRVRSGNAAGYAARVSVATRVRFYAPQAPYRKLEGFIAPARGGVAVKLARKRADGTWAAVTTVGTGSDGKFAFMLARGGTYRASADAGVGLLVGYTPPLTVG